MARTKWLTTLLFSIVSIAGFTQDANSIIDKYFQAIGGRGNWEAIETMSVTTLLIRYPGGLFEKNDTTIQKLSYKKPNLVRVDFLKKTGSSALSFDGRNFYSARDGRINVYPEEEGQYFSSTTAMAGQADIFLEVENILSSGEKEINGITYNVIVAKRPEWGFPVKYCFDKQTGFLSIGFSKESVLTYHKNYNEIDGLKFETTQEVYSNGVLLSRAIVAERVINMKFEPDHFTLN